MPQLSLNRSPPNFDNKLSFANKLVRNTTYRKTKIPRNKVHRVRKREPESQVYNGVLNEDNEIEVIGELYPLATHVSVRNNPKHPNYFSPTRKNGPSQGYKKNRNNFYKRKGEYFESLNKKTNKSKNKSKNNLKPGRHINL